MQEAHVFALINSAAVIIFTILGLIYLFRKVIRKSPVWHATVTPLASIIGSGFLVAGPVLVMLTGNWAILAMTIIVFISYLLGDVIRFNIIHLEPNLESPYKQKKTFAWFFDRLSHPVIAIAYIISVTFYLKLLSAFALSWIHPANRLAENLLTTALLVLIGVTGKIRGLMMLERYEIYTVSIKIAIILGLLLGLFFYNLELIYKGSWALVGHDTQFNWLSIQKILGLLIIVQGFETSRYLGLTYGAELRVNTMKIAQWIAMVIYILFIALSLVIFDELKEITETSIIQMSGIVAPVLPLLLIFAAITSQFSASVADIIGSGGLIREASKRKIETNTAYLLISIICIGLTWVVDIYEVIAIASKAFALYYALQSAAALVTLHRRGLKGDIRFITYVFLLILCSAVVVFGTSVE